MEANIENKSKHRSLRSSALGGQRLRSGRLRNPFHNTMHSSAKTRASKKSQDKEFHGFSGSDIIDSVYKLNRNIKTEPDSPEGCIKIKKETISPDLHIKTEKISPNGNRTGYWLRKKTKEKNYCDSISSSQEMIEYSCRRRTTHKRKKSCDIDVQSDLVQSIKVEVEKDIEVKKSEPSQGSKKKINFDKNSRTSNIKKEIDVTSSVSAPSDVLNAEFSDGVRNSCFVVNGTLATPPLIQIKSSELNNNNKKCQDVKVISQVIPEVICIGKTPIKETPKELIFIPPTFTSQAIEISSKEKGKPVNSLLDCASTKSSPDIICFRTTPKKEMPEELIYFSPSVINLPINIAPKEKDGQRDCIGETPKKRRSDLIQPPFRMEPREIDFSSETQICEKIVTNYDICSLSLPEMSNIDIDSVEPSIITLMDATLLKAVTEDLINDMNIVISDNSVNMLNQDSVVPDSGESVCTSPDGSFSETPKPDFLTEKVATHFIPAKHPIGIALNLVDDDVDENFQSGNKEIGSKFINFAERIDQILLELTIEKLIPYAPVSSSAFANIDTIPDINSDLELIDEIIKEDLADHKSTCANTGTMSRLNTDLELIDDIFKKDLALNSAAAVISVTLDKPFHGETNNSNFAEIFEVKNCDVTKEYSNGTPRPNHDDKMIHCFGQLLAPVEELSVNHESSSTVVPETPAYFLLETNPPNEEFINHKSDLSKSWNFRDKHINVVTTVNQPKDDYGRSPNPVGDSFATAFACSLQSLYEFDRECVSPLNTDTCNSSQSDGSDERTFLTIGDYVSPISSDIEKSFYMSPTVRELNMAPFAKYFDMEKIKNSDDPELEFSRQLGKCEAVDKALKLDFKRRQNLGLIPPDPSWQTNFIKRLRMQQRKLEREAPKGSLKTSSMDDSSEDASSSLPKRRRNQLKKVSQRNKKIDPDFRKKCGSKSKTNIMEVKSDLNDTMPNKKTERNVPTLVKSTNLVTNKTEQKVQNESSSQLNENIFAGSSRRIKENSQIGTNLVDNFKFAVPQCGPSKPNCPAKSDIKKIVPNSKTETNVPSLVGNSSSKTISTFKIPFKKDRTQFSVSAKGQNSGDTQKPSQLKSARSSVLFKAPSSLVKKSYLDKKRNFDHCLANRKDMPKNIDYSSGRQQVANNWNNYKIPMNKGKFSNCSSSVMARLGKSELSSRNAAFQALTKHAEKEFKKLKDPRRTEHNNSGASSNAGIEKPSSEKINCTNILNVIKILNMARSSILDESQSLTQSTKKLSVPLIESSNIANNQGIISLMTLRKDLLWRNCDLLLQHGDWSGNAEGLRTIMEAMATIPVNRNTILSSVATIKTIIECSTSENRSLATAGTILLHHLGQVEDILPVLFMNNNNEV